MAKIKLLEVIGIICVTALGITNMVVGGPDHLLLSAIIGAIVFIITRKHYKA